MRLQVLQTSRRTVKLVASALAFSLLFACSAKVTVVATVEGGAPDSGSSPDPQQSSPTPTPSPVTPPKIVVKQIVEETGMVAPYNLELLDPGDTLNDAMSSLPLFKSIADSTYFSTISGGGARSAPLMSDDSDYVFFLSNHQLTNEFSSASAGTGFAKLYSKRISDDSMELISTDSSGEPFFFYSEPFFGDSVSVSNDRRFVLFSSPVDLTLSGTASGLSGSKLFLKDLHNNQFIPGVDESSMTSNAWFATPEFSHLSRDGRFVFYYNSSDGLIYREDTRDGNPAEVASIDAHSTSNLVTHLSGSGVLSASGNGSEFVFVANVSGEPRLILRNMDTNQNTEIFAGSVYKAILNSDTSADRKVFFTSYDSNFFNSIGSLTGVHTFMWSQANPGSITLISKNDQDVPFNQSSAAHSVSADGRFVCMSTSASNTNTGPLTPAGQKILVKDTLTGKLVVANSHPDGADFSEVFTSTCSLSPDGKYVTYESSILPASSPAP